MNERMLELAKQAGLKKEHGADREYIGDFDWRLFGQLIALECVKVSLQSSHRNDDMGAIIARHIKYHLGVDQ